ncbi:acetate/propionate family kinase [Steroidobacter agaridevorans]|uniref:acetate/propionate family kinase n=1 Tax=Steroidobacter agaridevorans TaxID=2695856 RepID=UPI001324165D|nr:acetate/propionate family kinase [Steroidobacter agaridevorans]GFE89300.1 acetate kinase [Steroidobacter agaridevorans]
MRVLALNCGSSSVKSALIDTAHDRRLQEIQIENIGSDMAAAVDELLARYRALDASLSPEAVVHRVVHGGEKFRDPARLDDAVLDEIEQLNHLAPLHNPPALAAIRRAMASLPGVPHFAVFDTAFHSALPAHAREYALPLDIRRRFGIRRFGFHGINHEHVAHSVAAYLRTDVKKLRVISCHLGNGASVTAIEGGRSVDTSMGMTPLEGLVMGTRAGDVDPGVLLQLRRESHLDADELDDLLNKRSGLKGLAGTNDMREIARRASVGDEDGVLAIDLYVHRVRKYIGAYAAGMGGADAIAFTAGVGEHNALIRRRCSERLEFMGAVLDVASNERVKLSSEQPVAAFNAAGSRVHLLAVRADEELSMARATAAALAGVSAK